MPDFDERNPLHYPELTSLPTSISRCTAASNQYQPVDTELALRTTGNPRKPSLREQWRILSPSITID
jgi:hypothetical protein